MDDRTCALLTAKHLEMILKPVEVSKEDDAGLVEARRCLEDMPGEWHRGRQNCVKSIAVVLRQLLQCNTGSRRNRVENAEQRVRITLLVTGDQFGIVKVVAGIHFDARIELPPHGDLFFS